MINRNGKPVFAVRIDPEDDGRNASYVFVENGDVKFSTSWMDSIAPFVLGDRSHEIAKEIFTIGLQAAVKVKVMELMQLQSILTDINLQECLGSVLVDNTKLLLEVKESVSQSRTDIQNTVKSSVETAITKSQDAIKGTVAAALVETIQPVAIKKDKRTSTTSGNMEGI
jgi:hypothetical protein